MIFRLLLVLLASFAIIGCDSSSDDELEIGENYNMSDEDALDYIAKGQIKIGMNREEVSASWGEPTRKNVSEYSFGTHEQWVYDRGGFIADYVYFEDGLCTGIQYHDR